MSRHYGSLIMSNDHGGLLMMSRHDGRLIMSNEHGGIMMSRHDGGLIVSNDHGGLLMMSCHDGGVIMSDDHGWIMMYRHDGGLIMSDDHGGLMMSRHHALHAHCNVSLPRWDHHNVSLSSTMSSPWRLIITYRPRSEHFSRIVPIFAFTTVSLNGPNCISHVTKTKLTLSYAM